MIVIMSLNASVAKWFNRIQLYLFEINDIYTPQNMLPLVCSMLSLSYMAYDRTVNLTNQTVSDLN